MAAIDGKPILVCPYCGTVRDPSAKPKRFDISRISRRTKIVAACVVVAVVVVSTSLGTASAKSGIVGPDSTGALPAEDETRVPAVVNEYYEDAEAIAEEADLLLVISDKVYSDKTETDKVVEQTPLPGRVLIKESALNVVLSTNIEPVVIAGVMPDLVFHKSEDAITMLKYAGIAYTLAYENSDIVQQGNVIRQDVAAGENVPEGKTVTITISNGSEKQKRAEKKTTESSEETAPAVSGDAEAAQPEKPAATDKPPSAESDKSGTDKPPSGETDKGGTAKPPTGGTDKPPIVGEVDEHITANDFTYEVSEGELFANIAKIRASVSATDKDQAEIGLSEVTADAVQLAAINDAIAAGESGNLFPLTFTTPGTNGTAASRIIHVTLMDVSEAETAMNTGDE
ncbi:MAG: PASTA domain-containing protein [Clostridiales Family XIII bacterium]|jgi:hypothetical protein|nr:PASTA domain-containing protein [Clostridiales Family XIII bacterium]